jgi:Domain of unknown function (DUF4160)
MRTCAGAFRLKAIVWCLRAKDQRLLRDHDLDVLERGRSRTSHFHARYAGQTASVDFAGAVIAGSLPRRALALVAEWAAPHAYELAANWERARRDEPLEPIDAMA